MTLDDRADEPTVPVGAPALPSAAAPTRTHVGMPDHLESGRVLAGRYRIEGIVGVGGMGIVYRARDLQLDLPVAVKVLRPEHARDRKFLERFRRELILARQVSHRNVVRIHDIGQEGDLWFLTMDLVEGRSLRDILEEGGALPLARAVHVAKQLARALAGAHLEGVVHRDLKPDNVLVDDEDNAYITDFGIARSLGGVGLTRTGMVVGTPNYLSPEQARGEEVDGRSDLYTLGIMLFEMLADALPFRGGTDSEVLAQRLVAAPSLALLDGKVPPRMLAILRKLLDRDPARRYQTAPELLADLDAFEKPTAATWIPSWTRGALLPESPRRRRVVLVAGVLVALAAVGVLVAWPRLRARAGTATHAAASTATPATAVAVLPLEDQTGHPELAWTARGAAEMLAADLAESPGLRVVDSLRVFRTLADLGVHDATPAGGQLDSLAELLEADRLVTGRVRASGGQLQLEVRLLSPGATGGGTPLVATAASPSALPAAVRALASAVEKALAVAPGEADRRGTATPEAMAAYDRGVERLLAGDGVGALPWLEKATATDPRFTAAWLRLADAYQGLGRGGDASNALAQAAAHLDGASPRLATEVRARRALLAGDALDAERLLQGLVQRYPADVELLVALGSARGESGDLAGAAAALQQAVKRDARHPRAWFLLGKYAIQAGNARQALDEYLVRALVIQNQLGNKQGRADVLNAMGVGSEQLGRLGEAADDYAKAAELRQQIGDTRGYATTLRNLARIDSMQGRGKEAAARLDQARALLAGIGDRRGMADVLNDLGWLDEERGRYREALEQYRQALQARESLGDQRALAESYQNVGFAYYLLAEYDNAGVYWRQALDSATRSGDQQGAIEARQSLGLLQIAQGRWEEAARTLLAVLQDGRGGGSPASTAASLAYLGRLAHLQGRYGAALDAYRQALDVVRPLDDARGLVEFTLLEAETLLASGDATAAAARLDEAEKRLAAAPNDEQRARLLALRGRLALRRGDAAGAGRTFAQAVQAAGESDTPVLQLEARLGTALAALAGGDAPGAARTLTAVAADARRHGDVPLRLEAAAALARAQLAQGRAAEAAAAAHEALAAVPSGPGWGGGWELEATLADALARLGQADAAATARAQAGAELARVRRELPAAQRVAFDGLPEVKRLAAPQRPTR